MADADVLLVPSVMRESFSIVTREALQRGLPVLCTDSLGPEEVVVDGVNGMVVPSADPAALWPPPCAASSTIPGCWLA